MFKRFSVGILCACVSVWLFAACGGGGDNNSNSNSNTNSNSNSNGNENNNGGTGDCSTNPTYKACIQPIFQKSCGKAGECHGEGSKSGNLTLVGTSAADLQRDGEGFNSKDKGLKIVAPNKPDESLLYQKLLAPGDRASGFGETGSKMPLGANTIEQPAIDQIKKWIENGAKDD